jgi:hypothetical protein
MPFPLGLENRLLLGEEVSNAATPELLEFELLN